MNHLLSFLPNDGWQRLLCDALWQSTLIGTVGWLAARFLLRQAAARSWVLLLTISACAIAPLASFASRAQGWTVLAETLPAEKHAAVSENAPNDLPAAILSEPAHDPNSLQHLRVLLSDGNDSEIDPALLRAARSAIATVPVMSEPRRPEGAAMFGWPALGVVWIFVSGVLLIRFGCSLLATRRLLRDANSCQDSTLLAAVEKAAQRVGLQRRVRLFWSDRISTPMILPFGAPRLLVPSYIVRPCRSVMENGGKFDENTTPDRHGRTMYDSSDQDGRTICVDWTATFTHELAHVVRGDGWSRLWTEFVSIALPLSPPVWFVKHAFRTACEEACDDWVIATGTEPADFAATLTSWIKTPNQKAPLPAMGMSGTKSRLLRILSMKEKPMTKLRSISRVVLFLAFLLTAVGLAVAQTKKAPAPNPGASAKARVDTKKQVTPDPAEKSVDQRTGTMPPKDFSPPKEVLDALIADDSLVTVFDRRIEQAKKSYQKYWEELRQEKANGKRTESDEKSSQEAYEKEVQPLQVRRAKRVEEITPKIVQQVWESQLRRKDNSDSGIKPYVIEPPDILLVKSIQLVPKKPYQIEPRDKVKVQATGTRLDQPINGIFQVDSAGEIVLGPGYGAVKLSGLNRREAEEAVTTQLQETLNDPQVAITMDESRPQTGISGEHLVGPDGTINLGDLGSVRVGGLTLQKAKDAIESQLSESFQKPKISVDVQAYNSKAYYVVFQLDGLSDTVQRFPLRGSERVIDAFSQAKQSLRTPIDKVWISRPTPEGDEVFPVKWYDVLRGKDTTTNYRLMPGDRVFIKQTNGTTQPEAEGGTGADTTKSATLKEPTDSKPGSKRVVPNAEGKEQSSTDGLEYYGTRRLKQLNSTSPYLNLLKRGPHPLDDEPYIDAIGREPALRDRGDSRPPTFHTPSGRSEK